jgi:hypothetical protein
VGNKTPSDSRDETFDGFARVAGGLGFRPPKFAVDGIARSMRQHAPY